MKNALLAVAAAVTALATASAQAVTVVDSFDSGVSNASLNVVLQNDPGSGGFSITDPGINSALAGTTHTRVGELFGYGPSTGFIHVPLDGAAAISFSGLGHASISYSFLADLRGYSSLNVIGSGMADMTGLVIYLTDADGDEAGKRFSPDGAFGNMAVDLSALDEIGAYGNGTFDLSRINGISVYAEVGWGVASQRLDGSIIQSITEINLTPVPEPGNFALMMAGLSVLGLLARRRPRAS